MLRLGRHRQSGDMHMIARIRAKLKRLAGEKSGVAFVEFAMALPLVLGATLSGLEIAWMAFATKKVNQIAAQAAVNAARVTGTIDETDISEIMTATRVNGESIKFVENGGVVISSVQLNDRQDGQWIRWQRCSGQKKLPSRYGIEGKGRYDNSLDGIGKTAPKMKAGPGVAIIVAEVKYEYQSLISDTLFGQKTLDAETAFVVRHRNNLGITNTTNLSETQKLKC